MLNLFPLKQNQFTALGPRGLQKHAAGETCPTRKSRQAVFVEQVAGDRGVQMTPQTEG